MITTKRGRCREGEVHHGSIDGNSERCDEAEAHERTQYVTYMNEGAINDGDGICSSPAWMTDEHRLAGSRSYSAPVRSRICTWA